MRVFFARLLRLAKPKLIVFLVLTEIVVLCVINSIHHSNRSFLFDEKITSDGFKEELAKQNTETFVGNMAGIVKEKIEALENIMANNNQSCNIFSAEKQYSVSIDGHVYPQFLLLSQNYSYNFDCINKTGPTKLILGWNKFYGTPNLGYGGGKVQPFVDRHCPVTNCELTDDHSRLSEADYVVVHFRDDPGPIPVERNAKTRWVWMLIEAPFYTGTYDHLNK